MMTRERVARWLKADWLEDEMTDGTLDYWDRKADELLALISESTEQESPQVKEGARVQVDDAILGGKDE